MNHDQDKIFHLQRDRVKFKDIAKSVFSRVRLSKRSKCQWRWMCGSFCLHLPLRRLVTIWHSQRPDPWEILSHSFPPPLSFLSGLFHLDPVEGVAVTCGLDQLCFRLLGKCIALHLFIFFFMTLASSTGCS